MYMLLMIIIRTMYYKYTCMYMILMIIIMIMYYSLIYMYVHDTHDYYYDYVLFINIHVCT